MMRDRRWSIGAVILVVAAFLGSLVAPAGATDVDPCPADCDRDGVVEVGDLLQGVSISTGRSPHDSCPSFDRDGDGRIAVSELVAAVVDALEGCPCGGSYARRTCGGVCPQGTTCEAIADGESCGCVEPDPSPCGGTAPSCNGTCPAGMTCATLGRFRSSPCGCIDEGAVRCGGWQDETCGGACPPGSECRGDGTCWCAPVGGCPSGFFERFIAEISVGCVPNDCFQPMLCGDECGRGSSCERVVVTQSDGEVLYRGCVCATSDLPCGPGGVACPGNQVCVTGFNEQRFQRDVCQATFP